jgi:hypothetical protein
MLRAILGVTPPGWTELARFEHFDDIPQNAARTLDRTCREDPGYVRRLEERYRAGLEKHNKYAGPPPDRSISLKRVDALIQTAISCISQGAPKEVDGVIHRMAKFDTFGGVKSLQCAARENVPYAILLYERYLGRPFAAHRDAVSELVGEVMETQLKIA